MMMIPLMLLLLPFVFGQTWNTNSPSLPAPSLDRTIDLASLGIDFEQIFDELLSPKGIVLQFVLSIFLQILNVLGYLITGAGYAFLVDRSDPGPFLDAVKFFEIILTPQVIILSLKSSIILC